MSHLIGRRNPREAYPVRSNALPRALAQPLTAEFWVDSGTTIPVAQRTGSVLAPFGSLQAAYDAAVAAGLTQLNIMGVSFDPAENLTMTAALKQIAIIGLSSAIAYVIPSLVAFGDIIGAGAGEENISLQNVQVDSILNDAHLVFMSDCLYTTTIYIPSGTFVASNSGPRAGSAPTVTVGVAELLDYGSEQSLFSSGGTIPNTGLYYTTAGGPNAAFMAVNAHLTSNFASQSRCIYPAGLLSAARTFQLNAGASKPDKSRASIDCYTQGFDLGITDQTSTATLMTIAAGSAPTRATFIYDTASTQWSALMREILAAP